MFMNCCLHGCLGYDFVAVYCLREHPVCITLTIEWGALCLFGLATRLGLLQLSGCSLVWFCNGTAASSEVIFVGQLEVLKQALDMV